MKNTYLVGAGDVEYIDNVGGCGAEHKVQPEIVLQNIYIYFVGGSWIHRLNLRQ